MHDFLLKLCALSELRLFIYRHRRLLLRRCLLPPLIFRFSHRTRSLPATSPFVLRYLVRLLPSSLVEIFWSTTNLRSSFFFLTIWPDSTLHSDSSPHVSGFLIELDLCIPARPFFSLSPSHSKYPLPFPKCLFLA